VLFGDPLFVRSTRGVVPTPRALELAEPIQRGLAELDHAVRLPASFDPGTTGRIFRAAMLDYGELILLPRILDAVASEAPGAAIHVTSPGVRVVVEELEQGRLDFAIAARVKEAKAGIKVKRLFGDRFVCVVRAAHPSVGKTISLEQYLALPHVRITTREDESSADLALAEVGKKRRVVASVPHFLVAPHLVACSDGVLTVSERVARVFAPALGLRVLGAPLPIADFSVYLLWHERVQRDPGHQWLRERMARVAAALRRQGPA
jgi:DNA-binding transcriptional LysR family regulator